MITVLEITSVAKGLPDPTPMLYRHLIPKGMGWGCRVLTRQFHTFEESYLRSQYDSHPATMN